MKPSHRASLALLLCTSLATATTPEPAVGTLSARPSHAQFTATHARSAGFELREIEPGVTAIFDPDDNDSCFDDGTSTERSPTVHVRGLENASAVSSLLPVVRRERVRVDERGTHFLVDDAAYDVHTLGVQQLAHQSLRLTALGSWLHGSVQLFGARDGTSYHLVARTLDVMGEPSARASTGTRWIGACSHRYAQLNTSKGSWVDFDLPAVVPGSEHVTASGVCLRSERTLRVRVRANGTVRAVEHWIGAVHTEAVPGSTYGKPCPRSVASGGP